MADTTLGLEALQLIHFPLLLEFTVVNQELMLLEPDPIVVSMILPVLDS